MHFLLPVDMNTRKFLWKTYAAATATRESYERLHVVSGYLCKKYACLDPVLDLSNKQAVLRSI